MLDSFPELAAFYNSLGEKFEGQYIEGTAWQHSFFVPHDVEGLSALYGGKKVLANKFKVSVNENVSLYTIRHFDENAAQVVETNKTILLRQISRETMQVITKE